MAPEPVPMPQVGIRGQAIGDIADLHSIIADLDFARECAHAYAAPADEHREELKMRALWSAGIISYRRAFGSGRALLVDQGRRPRLDTQLVALLADEQRTVHEQVMEMASKHVAHRVGEHEQAAGVAVLEPHPSPRRVVGVGLLRAHMIGPPCEVAQTLSQICTLFMTELQTLADAKSDSLTEHLNATADLADLYRRASLPP